MVRSFRNVDRFIVYSSLEKELYPAFFGIPPEKIDVVLWGVGAPPVSPEYPLVDGDYACALGGNKRDYGTLLKAAELKPGIRLELVVRPQTLKDFTLPPNVNVRVNLPLAETMNILKFSKFMALPLDGDLIPAGHVTLVSAQHLGKAMIITESKGVADYILPGVNALTCPPGDAECMAEKMELLWEDRKTRENLERGGKNFATRHLSEEHVREHLARVIRELLDDSFPQSSFPGVGPASPGPGSAPRPS